MQTAPVSGTTLRPVISVGNLAMGGRGKTPVVALVARLLAEAGERPAILSRGYKRRCPEDGVVIVSDGIRMRADLDRAGDEPLMLARLVPGAAVLVCDVRALAAAVGERVVGATVHVLDDGFQHTSLRRDVDIVIVAPEDLAGRRMPFGRLRSPVRALARARAVIVDGVASADTIAAIRAHVGVDRAPIFALTRRLGSPRAIEDAPARDVRPGEQAPGPVIGTASGSFVAVAGIAAPDRFRQSLHDVGFSVVRVLRFPDHHRYDRRDVQRMARAVAETGAWGVMTTEKDAVRLLPLRPLPMRVVVAPLEVTIDPCAEGATTPRPFRDWLVSTVGVARR